MEINCHTNLLKHLQQSSNKDFSRVPMLSNCKEAFYLTEIASVDWQTATAMLLIFHVLGRNFGMRIPWFFSVLFFCIDTISLLEARLLSRWTLSSYCDNSCSIVFVINPSVSMQLHKYGVRPLWAIELLPSSVCRIYDLTPQGYAHLSEDINEQTVLWYLWRITQKRILYGLFIW